VKINRCINGFEYCRHSAQVTRGVALKKTAGH